MLWCMKTGPLFLIARSLTINKLASSEPRTAPKAAPARCCARNANPLSATSDGVPVMDKPVAKEKSHCRVILGNPQAWFGFWPGLVRWMGNDVFLAGVVQDCEVTRGACRRGESPALCRGGIGMCGRGIHLQLRKMTFCTKLLYANIVG